jgi:hypothetical protein
MRETQYFSASFDNLVKGITAFVFILFGVIGYLSWNSYRQSEGEFPLWVVLLMTSFFLLILGISWALHPTGYSLNPDRLTIHRPFSNIDYHLQEIEKIITPSNEDLRWTMRTFGNGGLFGIYGKFWNKKFGSMTWYATRKSNFILLELTNNRRIVITPDDLSMSQVITNLIKPRSDT